MAQAETHSLAIHLSIEHWEEELWIEQTRITNHSPQLIVRIFPVAIQWIEGT